MKTKYEEYALLDAELKALTLKKELLRKDILEGMVEDGQDKITTPLGNFSVVMLKTWEYPKEVLEIGEKFKSEKAKAESVGTATYTEAESLRFTQIKI